MAGMIEQIIPHLLGGISEQPTYLRGPTHSTKQYNTLPLLSRGLIKRPPSEFIANLALPAPLTEHAFIKIIDMEGERYVLLIDNGDLTLWNFKGQLQQINFPQGKTYLQGQRFDTLTIGDSLYILNKDKEAKMKDEADANRPYEALVFVKQAVAQTSYQLIVTYANNRIETNITSAAQERSTSNIAQQLKNDLSGKLPANLFAFELQGSTFRISSNNQDFTIVAKDGYGDQALDAFKDTTQEFHNLPHKAYVGFVIEVATDPETKQDSFYVTYTDKGVWKETVQPGLKNTLDPSTLPHKLVFDNGAFTFSHENWGKRCAGDTESCPPPSFVGQTISSLFVYKNRLGLLSEDCVILSEVDDYTNFWPTTTATVLEGDSIDIAIPHGTPLMLHHAIPLHNGNLLLFSEKDQFILKGEEMVSPRSLQASLFSHYECSREVKPIIVDQGVFFATKDDLSPRIRELIPVESDTQHLISEEITAHVPTLFRFPLKKLVHQPCINCVFALKKKGSILLEVYTYHTKGETKTQSAWSQWFFHYSLMDIDVRGSDLILLFRTSEGLSLEIINMDATHKNLMVRDLSTLVHIDRYVKGLQGNYDAGSNTTTWALPYTPSIEQIYVITVEQTPQCGQYRTQGNQITLQGDYSNQPVIFGEVYNMCYEFAEITLKDMGQSGSVIAEPNGKLYLRHLILTYDNTGAFKVTVSRKGLNSSTSEFTPYEGFTEPSGVFRIPLLGNSHDLRIKIHSNTPAPCSFQNAAWTGLYATHSRRV